MLEFDPSSLEYKLDVSGAKTRVEASSEEWLNLSPQEVDDLIAQKQSEMDAYLTRKQEKRSGKGKEKIGETGAGSPEQAKRAGELSDVESDTESLDTDANDAANPMNRLASTVKQFIQNTSSYEGVHSRDGVKTKEHVKAKSKSAGFDDSSSEEESDDFYKYAIVIDLI